MMWWEDYPRQWDEQQSDGPTSNLNQPEPPPTPNEQPAVWDLVMADMRERDAKGLATYGVRLQPHNGRKALIEAYQEVLDLAVYLRQEIYEREGR